MSKFDRNLAYIKSDIGKNEIDKEIDKLEKRDKSFTGIQIDSNDSDKLIFLTIFLSLGENSCNYGIGKAICMDEDYFDIRVGIELAYARAKIDKLEMLYGNKETLKVLKEQCEEMESVIEDVSKRLNNYYNNL